MNHDLAVKHRVHPIIIILLSFRAHNALPPLPASRASAGSASDVATGDAVVKKKKRKLGFFLEDVRKENGWWVFMHATAL